MLRHDACTMFKLLYHFLTHGATSCAFTCIFVSIKTLLLSVFTFFMYVKKMSLLQSIAYHIIPKNISYDVDAYLVSTRSNHYQYMY